MKDKILELIRRNRISSVEVADALGKTGVIDGLAPLNPGHFVAGELWYAATWLDSNWPLHEQLQRMPRDMVVFVDGIQCEGRALFGDLVAKTICLYGGARGILVDGLVRDVHRLRKENYPLWCRGRSPLGCHNRNVSPSPEIETKVAARRAELQGAIVVADDSGYTLIEASRQTPELYGHLEYIELQEDIWYYCIDTLKLSTYDTVCRKIYLEQPDILPQVLRDRLLNYRNKLES